MRVTNVDPHPNFRLGDVHEQADFARVTHAQLHDRHFCAVSEIEQRKWQTEVVVQIALVLRDPVPTRKELGNRFLRRRLSGTASDGNHLGRRLAPYEAREVLESRRSVGYFDDEGRLIRIKVPFIDGSAGLHHDAGRSTCQGVANKRMPIALSNNREKQIPWRKRSRIDREAIDPAVLRTSGKLPARRRHDHRRRQYHHRGRHLARLRRPRATPAQRSSRDRAVVERQHAIANLLILFVALARD